MEGRDRFTLGGIRNTMVADDIVAQGAIASAAIALV